MQRCGVQHWTGVGTAGWTSVAAACGRCGRRQPAGRARCGRRAGRPVPSRRPRHSAGARREGFRARRSDAIRLRRAGHTPGLVGAGGGGARPLLPAPSRRPARLAAVRHELTAGWVRRQSPCRRPARDAAEAIHGRLRVRLRPGSARRPTSCFGLGRPRARPGRRLRPLPPPTVPPTGRRPAARTDGARSVDAPADGGPGATAGPRLRRGARPGAWVWTGYAGLPFLLATAEPPGCRAAGRGTGAVRRRWLVPARPRRLICDVGRRRWSAGPGRSHWTPAEVCAAAPADPARSGSWPGSRGLGPGPARLLGPGQDPPRARPLSWSADGPASRLGAARPGGSRRGFPRTRSICGSAGPAGPGPGLGARLGVVVRYHYV